MNSEENFSDIYNQALPNLGNQSSSNNSDFYGSTEENNNSNNIINFASKVQNTSTKNKNISFQSNKNEFENINSAFFNKDDINSKNTSRLKGSEIYDTIKENNSNIISVEPNEFNMNEKALENNPKESLDDISEIKDEIISSDDEESFTDFDNYLIKKNNNLSYMNQICEYLINFFYHNELQNKIIRCPFEEQKEIEDDKNYCIPIINKTKLGMEIQCPKNDNKKETFSIIDLLKIIKDNKFLIDKVVEIKISDESISNKNIIFNEKKEGLISVDVKKNKMESANKIAKANKNLLKRIKSKFIIIHKKYTKFLQQKENDVKELKNKMTAYFFIFQKLINNLVYLIIQKKLIKESLNPHLNADQIKSLEKNFDNGPGDFKFHKKKSHKNKVKNQDEKGLLNKKVIKHKYKLNWIIPFYFQDEIININNNNIEKNLFIAISSNGFVIIYLLNIINNDCFDDKKFNFELICKENLECTTQAKIIKTKIFKNKNLDERKNNYFLISSYGSEKVSIINVIDDQKIGLDLKDRYKIKIHCILSVNRGLLSSFEIELNKEFYILNYNEAFRLYFYNDNTEKIEFKDIECKNFPKKNEEIKKREQFGPLIYSKNRNIIIVEIYSPYTRIEVYKLNEINSDIYIEYLYYIDFCSKWKNSIAFSINNYFLYKDRYLFITAQKSKNKDKGGLYILNLETHSLENYITFKDAYSLISILSLNDNTIICSGDIITKSNKEEIIRYNGGLISLEISENDGKICLLEKEIFKGTWKYINCDYIYESIFFSSDNDLNAVIKLENGGFKQAFNIYRPEEFSQNQKVKSDK